MHNVIIACFTLFFLLVIALVAIGFWIIVVPAVFVIGALIALFAYIGKGLNKLLPFVRHFWLLLHF